MIVEFGSVGYYWNALTTSLEALSLGPSDWIPAVYMFLPPPTVATTGKSHFALRLRLCRAFFIERVTKSFFVVHFLEGARSKNAQQITCLPNDVGIFLLFFLLFAERGCTEMFDFVLPQW
jgi:hypothetical protein